ncbi:MAG TPA: ABC transporter substrate-binding protein [Alphaproteobacteria bacterium]|nr:ABC transporter substrate-binding protein [Alphaproteobacteria bacterium]
MNHRHVLWIILVVLGAVLGGVGSGWAAQPKYGGTLRVALEADVTGFDPAVPGLQNYYVNQNLFNTLVTLDENLEFVPDLAESWEVQEQGKVYIFRLRKGVKFHDGTDFDAAAAKWNLDRIIADGKAPAHRFFANVESSEVVDAHTLKITMRYPTATLLPALATNGTGLQIISPASEKTWGKDVLRHPSGTGPFRFVSWEPNSRIVFERNPNYFKPGLPYLDRIEYRIMKEGVTRVAALRAGEVDFVNWTPRESVERLSKDPNVRVLQGPEASHLYTNFTVTRKPFDDVRVRKALIGYGLNRSAIAKSAMLGYATPSISFVSPGAKGYLDLAELYPYNPERARALLKEAGFDEKNPLRYTIMTHGAEPSLPTIATIIKTQMAAIGVEVTVEVIDRPIFLRRLLRDRDYDQVINMALPFLDVGDRGFVLEQGGLNLPNHNDSRVDELFDQWRRALDPQAQRTIAEEIQRYVAENAMYMAICGNPIINAHRADVKGYSYMRGLLVMFEQTWIDRR